MSAAGSVRSPSGFAPFPEGIYQRLVYLRYSVTRTGRFDRVDPVVVHANDRIVHANAAAVRLLGGDALEEIVGEPLSRFVDEPSAGLLVDQFDRLVADDTRALASTIGVETAAGRSEAVAVNSPIEWAGERRIKTTFFAIDTTLPSGLTSETMDASPIGITIADATRPDEPLIYVNDGFCELSGYDREEILGRNCRFLQGEATDEDTVAEIRAAIDAGEPITAELRNYRKDGPMFWNRLTVTPVRDERGQLTHFLGYQEDVTDRKLSERERSLFEMQADEIEQAVFITDAEGVIEYVNPAFERVTGYTAGEAIGENPRLLKSDTQDDAFYEELWETITAGEIWEAELTNRRKSGERYRTTQKIVPVTDPNGTITHFVAIEEDITDAQFIEQVLNVMDRVLRHNVRNSVTAIAGFADLLTEQVDGSEHRAAIRTIKEHAEELRRLSDETRTIRELFHRRHTQHTLTVDAIPGFVEARREQHPEAEIDLTMDVAPGAEIENGSLLQLAIDEALENAVVHNDTETPTVDVAVRQSEDGEEIVIEIADDGPGIPGEFWDVITAGEETPVAHITGIGLWLMYWTTTALGGAMDYRENDPRGSVVTFRVPMSTAGHLEPRDP